MTMTRSRPGTARNNGAGAGPQAMVTRAPGCISNKEPSTPVDRTQSPIRLDVMKKIFTRVPPPRFGGISFLTIQAAFLTSKALMDQKFPRVVEDKSLPPADPWSRVAVITVTHRSAALVQTCVGSVAKAAQIIVVDNASDDGTSALVRRALPAAEIIENAINRGFGTGCNQGLDRVKVEFALLLGPDSTIDDASLAALVAAAERWPEAGLLGLRSSPPTATSNCRTILDCSNALARENAWTHTLYRRGRCAPATCPGPSCWPAWRLCAGLAASIRTSSFITRMTTCAYACGRPGSH